MHPKSGGEVRLRSVGPQHSPRIPFNCYTDPRHLLTMREGFRRPGDLAAQNPMDPFRGNELAPGSHVNADADLDGYIRRTTMTAHHPCGTCAMRSGSNAVAGPELRVKGTEGPRAVDASAMPRLVTAHIKACVVMMAEKAADIIRSGSSLSPMGQGCNPVTANRPLTM
ncbi:GMC oxidoreductase [Bradyrhizobium sp. ma5]|uniref:GMC oxidoreductase n=1 Tax=Bradyrhizobium sp. ma5 TaxID=3344828 RepID=UPI0035D45A3C